MTNPTRTIEAIIGVAESIGSNWAMYATVEAALLPAPLRGTSYDSAGGHGSSIPDPTGSLATQLTSSGHGVHNLADTSECLDAVLAQLRWAQSRVNALIRQHPDVARDAASTLSALRCDGSIDPTCTRNAVKGGICHACIKARQRQNNGTVVDMSTRSVVEPLAYEPRPVEPQLSHTVTCQTCGTDYRLPADIDPQTWHLEHKAICAG